DQGDASGGAVCIRYLINPLTIDLAFIREEKHSIETAGWNQRDNFILILGGMTQNAASTATLRAESSSCHALNIAALSETDQHRLILDKVFIAQGFRGFARDSGAAIIAIFLGQVSHIVLNQSQDLFGACQQILQIGYLLSDLLVFLFDLPALQGSQTAQLHIQNGLRLKLAQLEMLDQVCLGLIGIL